MSNDKKKKAKNSFIDGGNEKAGIYKLKRIAYYCKKDRVRNKIFDKF